ncbi:MAG: DNA double-strand break repair nuclease NurA [Candidatus Caldarchaeum sp.]
MDVAFIAALAVVDDGKAFRRRLIQPKLLIQEYGEPDGDLADRVDVERENMMLELAQRVVREESPDLLVVDGPLVPRPKYTGEYILQLKQFHSLTSGVKVVGFVKRPQSRYLSNLPLTDRALLSTCLEKFSASPWPPAMITAFEGVSDTPVRYTYLRLLEEPESGVFRIDMHPSIDNLTAYEILSYLAYTSDPQKGPPSILMKADEEVKVSRRLVAELYRSCFTTIASKAEPKLWAPLILRWGERVW